ncbi:MAG: DUF3616 domain-containing protein [Candidatus Obscuribacterales bacterium]|nr:DUF3616 domain-containing protein [Candidatus Obscuribacterales bacterium]
MSISESDDAILIHQGMADASSAVPIGSDRFLVVTDEKNVFQLYRNDQSGSFLDEFPFSSFLNIESANDEADIEGSATVGDITYWIGSHSRNSQGRLALSRHQLFATIIKDKGDHALIRQVGQSYSGLLYDLMRNEEFSKLTVEHLDIVENSMLSSKSPGAVSIEGLSSKHNKLLVGFRNPIPEGQALVVPISNPLEIVLYGAHAEFDEFIRLDLEGRGIRSIDYWPERDFFVIVAGSFDKTSDFAYFTWSGHRKHQPQKLHTKGLDMLNPEALVFYPGLSDKMQIISDDGVKGDKKSKHHLSFRSVWVEF